MKKKNNENRGYKNSKQSRVNATQFWKCNIAWGNWPKVPTMASTYLSFLFNLCTLIYILYQTAPFAFFVFAIEKLKNLKIIFIYTVEFLKPVSTKELTSLPKFKIKVVGSYQDAMTRQISEAVWIELQDPKAGNRQWGLESFQEEGETGLRNHLWTCLPGGGGAQTGNSGTIGQGKCDGKDRIEDQVWDKEKA